MTADIEETPRWPGSIFSSPAFFEVGWAVGLKYTEGFSRLISSLLTIIAMALSLALLGLTVCIGLIVCGIAGLKFAS